MVAQTGLRASHNSAIYNVRPLPVFAHHDQTCFEMPMTEEALNQAVYLLGPWVMRWLKDPGIALTRSITIAHWLFVGALPPRSSVLSGKVLHGAKRKSLLNTSWAQFANYFSWHHEDGRGVRLAVYGLILLTILKSVQSL